MPWQTCCQLCEGPSTDWYATSVRSVSIRCRPPPVGSRRPRVSLPIVHSAQSVRRPSNPMPRPAPLINAVRPLRSNSETDIPKQPNRIRVTAFALSDLCLALLRDRLKCVSDRRRITEIVMPDRFQIGIEFVNQRLAGWNIELDNLVVRYAIEKFDQRA